MQYLNRLLVNNFVKAAGYIYLASVLEEALSSASCDSTSDSLLNHLSKYLPLNKNLRPGPFHYNTLRCCTGWHFMVIVNKACPFSGLKLEILWSSAARWGMVTVAANNLPCNRPVIEINRLSESN